MPEIIWTDHRRRLVLMRGGIPAENQYFLEVRAGDKDAMGKAQWAPLGLDWDVFKAILRSVQAWDPVILNPDEMQ